VAIYTRTEFFGSTPTLTNMISTRQSIEFIGLIFDGFTFAESAEITIYPFFSNDGGESSERTFVRQKIQKYITEMENNKIDASKNNLFTPDDFKNLKI